MYIRSIEDFERFQYYMENGVQAEGLNKPKNQPKTKKGKRKHEEFIRKRNERNERVRSWAKNYATKMRNEPSPLEQRMIEFLDCHGVEYQFQKIFYIKRKDNRIEKFYIADFYIPSRNIILETDGKFHDNQIKQDNQRSYDIKKHFPNVKILRWRFSDFKSPSKVKNLLKQVA